MFDPKSHMNYFSNLFIWMLFFNFNNGMEKYVTAIQQIKSGSIYNYKGTEPFLINTTGCYIPNFGKKLRFKEAADRKLSCNQRAIFLKKTYKRGIIKVIFRIDRAKMLKYHNKKKIEYECCYSFVVRSNKPGHEDKTIRYEKCIKLRSGSQAVLKQEVIVVECYTKTKKSNIRTTFYKDSYIFVKKQSINSKEHMKNWNVLLIGVDTMSRARIISAMPNMVTYLRAQGWLDYKGYQKMARDTYPNLMALLTGKKKETIDSSCRPDMYNCNDLFAWSTFRKSGYITAFGEDNVKLPDTFSRYNGFKSRPTHHYMRPLFLTGETERGNFICTKYQPSAKHILDYAYDFAETYSKEKFFGTFWINTFSHNLDYLPSKFEEDTTRFFKKLDSSGILNNSFVLFLSDHGFRFGPMRLPMESYYETRLPMLFIWVPAQFRKLHETKYYNLRLNQNRLVTPYDMYLTLVKIANRPISSSATIKSEACPLCQDLFEEIKSSRTCADAGISPRWCSCHDMNNADSFLDKDAINSVQYAASYIKNRTRRIETRRCTACSPLRLNRVIRIHSYKNIENKKNYVIAFEMTTEARMKAMTKISYEATILVNKNNVYSVGNTETITPYNSKGTCVKNRGDLGYCICRNVKCDKFRKH